ncbi:MAG: metallophosphoesterase [Symploca sp. SIO1C4]|uniref:Metallophosphoesterase n=1 Tax=Symploca sp. SIO1C4 TaxID=2607765 RepID=A0A6B3NDX9_9CYAN|nr:metallophosphoesterase [Symploca sp. SIO1C4]NET04486.1 metallophosphoesterase [Symploca sp. SIO2B6]
MKPFLKFYRTIRRTLAKLTLRVFGKIIFLVTVLGICSLTYAYKIEPGWIDISRVELTLPHLAPEFQGLRIAQISDIHIDDNPMTQERLEKIVQLINQQKPDLVAITGDFVSWKPELFAHKLAIALGKLKPKEATVAVLGNHDHWTNPTIIQQAIAQAGIIELSNVVYTLQRGSAQFNIAGVDDLWAGKNRLDLVLEQLPQEGAAILLVHEPDFADTSSATGRFDLQLSGHSHGGQVKFPLIKPPVLPPYGKKYPVGRYQVGEMIQYTNRGLGMVKPKVRFNSRPEITVFTLDVNSNS